MPRNPLYALLAVGLVLGLPTVLAGKAPPTATVLVDCTDPDPKKHGSINVALETPAQELTVEITGICYEDVLIQRSNVTLLGTAPALDGIRGVSQSFSISNAVLIVDSSIDARIENLSLADGARNIVGVRGGSQNVQFVGCVIENSQRDGVSVGDDSFTVVTDTVIRNHVRSGVIGFDASLVRCQDCTISDSPLGAAAIEGSRLSFTGGTVSGSGTGVLAQEGGAVVYLDGTDVTGGNWSLYATEFGEISAQGGQLSGSLASEWKSLLVMDGTEQTLNPLDFNFVDLDSTVRATNGSTVLGPTFVFGFSQVLVEGSSTLDGSLDCGSAGDAYCDDATTQVTGTSNCGQCLKP